jgi:hypothetical protein
MLEKPEIQDNKIIACMQAEYELRAAQITFLPLGADLNTAVYRATAGDAAQYFVKLRSGVFANLRGAAQVPRRSGHHAHHCSAGNSFRATLGDSGQLQSDSVPIH